MHGFSIDSMTCIQLPISAHLRFFYIIYRHKCALSFYSKKQRINKIVRKAGSNDIPHKHTYGTMIHQKKKSNEIHIRLFAEIVCIRICGFAVLSFVRTRRSEGVCWNVFRSHSIDQRREICRTAHVRFQLKFKLLAVLIHTTREIYK